jgi:nucleoside-diphosphate-sugar epimerase
VKALVIGGTGPTGPHVVQGLLDRDYEVTLFHRGVHEPPELPEVPHIHGDPHFPDTIREAVGDVEYDVVLAMYGRIRHIAEVLDGRCGHLICVGGVPVYEGCLEPWTRRPHGMRLLAREDSPLADANGQAPGFSELVVQAERTVFDRAAAGAYRATFVRYPCIYGPRNVIPYEWSVIRRVRDGRPWMILPDGGLGIFCRCAARNAAEILLLAVDKPGIADGQAYNCADRDQLTMRQWVETIAQMLDSSLELMSLPEELSLATYPELIPMGAFSPHTLLDVTKARTELGYTEVVSAQDALAQSVEWWSRNPPTPKAYPAYLDAFDYAAEDALVEAYQKAIGWVQEVAGRKVPDVFHGLPHPKVATVGVDERGR